MNRRVFEPRPTSSEARQRSAIGMALVVCVAAALLLLFLKNHPAFVTTAAPRAPVHAAPP